MIKYQLNKKKKFHSYEELNYLNPYKMKNKKELQGMICFYDQDIIYIVIKKKTDQSFKKILELIARMEEDDNPSEGYLLCLDEAEKYRQELISKYEKYLKKEQMNFLKKKLDLITKDLKNKLLVERLNLMEKEIEEKENMVSHHR